MPGNFLRVHTWNSLDLNILMTLSIAALSCFSSSSDSLRVEKRNDFVKRLQSTSQEYPILYLSLKRTISNMQLKKKLASLFSSNPCSGILHICRQNSHQKEALQFVKYIYLSAFIYSTVRIHVYILYILYYSCYASLRVHY